MSPDQSIRLIEAPKFDDRQRFTAAAKLSNGMQAHVGVVAAADLAVTLGRIGQAFLVLAKQVPHLEARLDVDVDAK